MMPVENPQPPPTMAGQQPQRSSSSSPHPEPPHTHTPLTAPSRGWIPQLKSKAIRVHSPDPHSPFPNPPDSRASPAPSPSAKRILELCLVQEQLAQLLSLASQVVGALSAPLDTSEGDAATPPTATQAQMTATFSDGIQAYFELLNKIQSSMRTSMSYLRASRLSTRILFEPAHVAIAHCAVGLGGLHLPPPERLTADHQEAPSSPSLSLGALVAERDAWKDLVEALQRIKACRAQSSP